MNSDRLLLRRFVDGSITDQIGLSQAFDLSGGILIDFEVTSYIKERLYRIG